MDGRKNKFKIFLLGYLCKVFPWDYTCRKLCFSVSSALEMLIEKATAGILTNDPSLSQKASLTNPQLGVLGEQRLWLEYLFLQTIKLL